MVAAFFTGWALELSKQKVGETLSKGLDRTLNPSALERLVGDAIASNPL